MQTFQKSYPRCKPTASATNSSVAQLRESQTLEITAFQRERLSLKRHHFQVRAETSVLNHRVAHHEEEIIQNRKALRYDKVKQSHLWNLMRSQLLSHFPLWLRIMLPLVKQVVFFFKEVHSFSALSRGFCHSKTLSFFIIDNSFDITRP